MMSPEQAAEAICPKAQAVQLDVWTLCMDGLWFIVIDECRERIIIEVTAATESEVSWMIYRVREGR